MVPEERKEMDLEVAGVVAVMESQSKTLRPKIFPEPLENWEVEVHLRPALGRDCRDNNFALASHMGPIPEASDTEYSD